MDKLEIRNFINQSYKGAKNMFLISSLGDDSITIIDYNMRVSYKFLAKKLINKYGFEMVHIKVGSEYGNGCLFTKSSLNVK